MPGVLFHKEANAPRQQFVGRIFLDEMIPDPQLLEELLREEVTVSMAYRTNKMNVIQGISTTLENLTLTIVCVEGQVDNAKNYQMGIWTLILTDSLDFGRDDFAGKN